MASPESPPHSHPNAFARKVYNPLGFKKGYNFALWFCFGGALLGFSLSRFMYLDFHGVYCSSNPRAANSALPGECYYYLNFSRYKVGILLHLATILPACVLVVLQFTPFIRHKWIIFHRINGYLVLILFLSSTVGALMITRHAFGGGVDVQSAIGALAISTVGSFVLSYINVKRLQIEQHRAWMLRGWFYAGTIITARFIMIIATRIISTSDSYYTARPCAQLAYMHKTEAATLESFPDCRDFFNGINPAKQVMVQASMTSGNVSELAASFGMNFGMAMWIGLWLHAIGVEVYLRLTPAEAERLRKVSYQRQLEAGMQNPGRAGLTADRLGDSELWTPGEKNRMASDDTRVED
ncbi:hypothetical protein B0J11DRAFT_525003 [Dendryphion nanum]|uniref:Microtubule associated protein n=1 Tax=Dendryphion nanum TaxID=256645 RepID=A0A9P9DXX8_9PLEO|nr:hypothetical protein B0J11DRAFT_525003 [Dendryphion nanum]